MTEQFAVTEHGVESFSGAGRLRNRVEANLRDEGLGIYSVCCAHPIVIEAAADRALADDSDLLIEATANQVNQFGGYTGMRALEFRAFVEEVASRRGLPPSRLIFGGDHLGPVCWSSETPGIAMDKAETLVRSYAAAGFTKIHLDCSMTLAGDPLELDDGIVAARAARLCAAAEAEAVNCFGSSDIVYVIGTEVPPPGGSDEAIDGLVVTSEQRVLRTLDVHREVFFANGLEAAWKRVIALVVQPGVEFDNSAVVDYDREQAHHLRQLAGSGQTGGIAFEAHSTDYQPERAFGELVNDHFAILKVGPALTFALREALFALSHIEDALLDAPSSSNLRAVCENAMLADPIYWQRFYDGDANDQALLRQYSLSDRIRYYWPNATVQKAVEQMLTNIDKAAVPLGLLRQFMPKQYDAIRNGEVSFGARDLVRHSVGQVLIPYAQACNGPTE